MSAPILTLSTQSGAPALSGETGKLCDVLSAALIINKAFSAVSGGSFLDRTTEARLDTGTAFTMMQTPGTSDEFYLGMSAKFNRATFKLATLGIGGTYVWEFWNGSAWTTLAVTDGTVGFTQNGIVTWTIPGAWATTAVNGTTQFWIRVRLTVANSTNPTVTYCTVGGWIEAFSGTSKRAYRSTVGNQMYLRVQDDGPGVGTFKEARITGYESMTDVDTGVAPFPTAAQGVGGIAMVVARKSVTADATARAYLILADDRTFYMFVLTADVASNYMGFMFGEIFSLASGDSYRTLIIARATENSGAAADKIDAFSSAINTAQTGHFMPRRYDATGTSITVGKLMDQAKTTAGTGQSLGNVPYPNTPDGGLYICSIWINEAVTTVLRARMRGVFVVLHAGTNFADGDTFSGTGVFTGKSFRIIRILNNNGGANGLFALETSDTWEVN
jgi:hypothetical protein